MDATESITEACAALERLGGHLPPACPELAELVRSAAKLDHPAASSLVLDHLVDCKRCWEWIEARVFDLNEAGAERRPRHATEELLREWSEGLSLPEDEAWVTHHVRRCSACEERKQKILEERRRSIEEFMAKYREVGGDPASVSLMREPDLGLAREADRQLGLLDTSAHIKQTLQTVALASRDQLDDRARDTMLKEIAVRLGKNMGDLLAARLSIETARVSEEQRRAALDRRGVVSGMLQLLLELPSNDSEPEAVERIDNELRAALKTTGT